MDIKEAYDVIYEHLKEECNKQDNCVKCLYGTACGSLPFLAYEKIDEFRKVYLEQQRSVKLNDGLIDNPYCNRENYIANNNMVYKINAHRIV